MNRCIARMLLVLGILSATALAQSSGFTEADSNSLSQQIDSSSTVTRTLNGVIRSVSLRTGKWW